MRTLDILKPLDINISNAEGGDERKASPIDGDTLKDIRDNRYRLRDIDTPETWGTHLGILSPPKAGAAELTSQMAILANHYGFTRIRETGSEDRNRGVVDMVNESGQNMSDYMVEERVTGANGNTSQEVLTNRVMNRFVDSMNTHTGKGDVGNRARAMVNASIRDSNTRPTWARAAVDEEQFALAKRMYSYNEMAAIAKRMEETEDPAERQKLQDVLYDLKQTDNPFQLGVETRSNDRTLDNKAYDNLTTSLSIGLENTAQAFYGLADMGGESAGWEWLKKKGEAGISRSNQRVSAKGTVLSRLGEIGETGNDIADSFTWLANNAAMSIPFMASVVAGGLLVAPLGGVAALGTVGALAVGAIPSAILTTGTIWNAMPEGEKSVPIAVAGGFAVGLLDRFGLKGVPKALAPGAAVQRGSIRELFNEIKGEVAEQLVKEKGYTSYQAIKKVEAAAKSQLVLMGNQFGTFASNKLRNLKMVKDTIRQISYATGREALTETIQTAIEEVAAVYGTSAELNPEQFQEALITAAIVGGVFGTGFSMPSIAKQYNDRRSILHAVDNPSKVQSEIDKYSQEDQELIQSKAEAKEKARVDIGHAPKELSPDDITYTHDRSLEEWSNYAVNNNTDSNYIREAAARNKAARKAEGFIKRTINTMMHHPGRGFLPMVKTMANKIGLTNADGKRNVTPSRMASVYSGIAINSGHTHQEYIVWLRGSLMSTLPDPEFIAQKLGTNLRGANRIMSNVVENFYNKGKVYDGPNAAVVNSILEEYKVAQEALINRYAELDLAEEAAALTVGGLDILTSRQVDQGRIKNDRHGFIEALQTLFPVGNISGSVKMSKDIAEVYASRLLSPDATQAAMDLHNAYDLTGGNLSAFMTGDILNAYRNNLGNTAKKSGDNKYLGKDNIIVSAALEKSVAEGVSQELVDEYAAEFLDYLEIANGDYGAWDSPYVKTIQDNLILVTYLRVMGFSALASWPEMALTQLGVPQDIAFNHISKNAKLMAESFADYMNYMVSLPPGSPFPRKAIKDSDARIYGNDDAVGETMREQLTRLGYSGSHAGATRQYGIDIGAWQQNIAEHYAKIVGLNNITDITRGMRASMAGDVMNHYGNILATDDKIESNMGREAYTELRGLGVNVQFIKNLHSKWYANPDYVATKEENLRLRKELDIATMRFIDQGMVHQLPGSVPKGFKHQKLYLFNQFQGYMANFTGNILPRILKQVASGSPGLITNALVTSLSMIAAAMFANMLRDQIKYGESTPYLDDYDKFRRVVFSSGLLGTTERVLQGFSPMYGGSGLLPTKGDGIGANINRGLEGIFGEMAAYGTVTTAVKGANEAVFGDNRAAAKHGLQLLPVSGSVNQINDAILDKYL